MRHAETADQEMAIAIGSTTGVDRGLIEDLTPDDIDWDTHQINDRRRKTGGKVLVTLDDQIYAELKRRAGTMRPTDRFFHGLKVQGWSRTVGRYSKRDPKSKKTWKTHQNNLKVTRDRRDWFVRVRAAAGVSDAIAFRDLRPYATGRLLRAGLTIRQAKDQLGHKSETTTIRHYQLPDPHVVSTVKRLGLPGNQRLSKQSKAKSAPAALQAS